MKYSLLSLIVAFTLCGCKSLQHSVLVFTATNIGVDISQNPQTQAPQARLGFNRGELVIVPIDAATRHVPDALTEIRYGNVFSTSDATIYQRVAVGSTAVSQPGAALMFGKGASGNLDAATAASIMQSLGGVPKVTIQDSLTLATVLKAYADAADKALFDSVARKFGFQDFKDFLARKEQFPSKMQEVFSELKTLKLTP